LGFHSTICDGSGFSGEFEKEKKEVKGKKKREEKKREKTYFVGHRKECIRHISMSHKTASSRG
jgi:hypothetical protein